MISFNTSIVRSGLVLHLDAANVKSYPGNGAVWNDLTGNVNNDPSKNGNITYSNGSFVFDGVDGSFFYDEVVSLPDSSSDITILCWCKPDSTGPADLYTGLVAVGSSTPGGTTPSNSVVLCLTTTETTWHVGSAYWGNDYTPRNLPVVKDAWNMVGIVARSAATTNNATLISANSTGLTTLTGSSAEYTRGLSINQTKFRVGSTDVNGDRPMKGEIAIVMIYNRELTLAEITQNFEAFRARYGI